MFEKQRRKWYKGFDLFLKKRFGWLPARISLAVMAWFGQVNLYMVRVNVSVAIVAMVKRNTTGGPAAACLFQVHQEENANSSTNATIDTDGWQTTTPMSLLEKENEEGEFLWSETIQGVVLGSFFYGYALTQIVGGRMAELYGTRIVYGFCIFGGGTLAILSPVVARLHYGAFIALRILQGMFQGASWPSLHALISRWIPPIEREKFVAIVYLAATLSSAITMPLVGAIIANHGWASQFYVMGVLSLCWCCVWFSLMYNSPGEHPRISPEELDYIQTSLEESGTKKSSSKRIPWKDIFTSIPFWGLLISSVGSCWGMNLFFAQLPTYMKNVLGFSIKANGGISALPFLCRYIGGIMWSSLCASLIRKKIVSIRNARRVFGIISFIGPAAMILGVSFSECKTILIVVFFCVCLFLNGASTASGLVNHTDIAPNFAGTLLGITNTVCSIVAFIVPIVTGVIIDGQQTIESWQKVFWICVPIYLITGILFVSFVSGEVQSWNDIDLVRSKRQKKADVVREHSEDVSLKTTE